MDWPTRSASILKLIYLLGFFTFTNHIFQDINEKFEFLGKKNRNLKILLVSNVIWKIGKISLLPFVKNSVSLKRDSNFGKVTESINSIQFEIRTCKKYKH